MIKINGINHVTLTVSQFEAARTFYKQLLPALGLELVFDGEDYFYHVGARTGVGIYLCTPEHSGERFVQGRIGLHHMCFRARSREDVDATHDLLVEMGAHIVTPPSEGIWAPGYYYVLFEDPDGIRLEVAFVPGHGVLAENVQYNPGTAERKRNLTKEKIVGEGARVFNKRGYYGTTLDDIARELGVTKAALYYHVRSKEEILYECHKTGLDIAMLAVERGLQSSSAPNDQLWIAIAYFVEHVTDRLLGAVVLVEEGSLTGTHRKEIFHRRDEWESEIRQIIKKGISQGIFVDCDPKLIGFAILGAVNWVNKGYDPSGPCAGREIGEAFASFLTRGLMKKPVPYLENAAER